MEDENKLSDRELALKIASESFELAEHVGEAYRRWTWLKIAGTLAFWYVVATLKHWWHWVSGFFDASQP